MKNRLKYNKFTVLILVVLVQFFEHSLCEVTNMTFIVTDDEAALLHGVKMDGWKVGNKLECHVKCGREKGCVTLEFDYDFNTCTVYGESCTETGLQRTPGSIVTKKIWSDGWTDDERRIEIRQCHSQDSENTFIGFTSWKTNQQTFTTSQLAVVTFEKVPINVGLSYNSTTSSFICPSDGVYMVLLTVSTISKSGGDRLYTYLDKGSDRIMSHLNNGIYIPGNTVSYSVILDCQAEESLTVKGEGHSSNQNDTVINGDYNIPYTTFTSFLITNLSDFVGFSVSMATSQIGSSYSEGAVIKLTGQILNITNYYNTATGEFRCPVTGVYFITLTARKEWDFDLQFSVKHNETIILHNIDTNTENIYKEVTNSRLVECGQGDVMMVTAVSGGKVWTATFSGVLTEKKGISEMGPFTFVGFTATKTSNQTYNNGTGVIFDNILLLKGKSGYDSSSGMFHCPSSGIYFVTVTARRQGSADLQIDVKHGSVVVFRLKSTSPSNPYITITNQALVRCGVGETIQVVGAGDGQIYGHPDLIVTTFTAMMVHRE